MSIPDKTGKSQIEVYHIHAFSDVVYGGNPAGVCLLDTWLDDMALSRIARDLGPSVTAFVLAAADGTHPLRWFTRTGREVDSFCGHATFSAAHVLLRLKRLNHGKLQFLTVSGTPQVVQSGEYLSMTVPCWPVEESVCPDVLVRSIGRQPAKCYRGQRDYLLVFDTEAEVMQLRPDYNVMRELGHEGVIATAQRGEANIVHRFFCPGFSIAENEDHATGSALSSLVPYWTSRLGISEFTAHQVSARGGSFYCAIDGGVITIAAYCATFLVGTIDLGRPDRLEQRP
jgi:predicted PhzF superfamily epimerase YddE/YHI9